VRRFAVAFVLLGLGAGCGGGDAPADRSREQVRAYITAANGVQQRFAPELEKTNEAYVAYARGDLAPEEALLRLQAGERLIVSARESVDELKPPREAAELHARLRKVYALNVSFAHQTALLASYQGEAEAALAPVQPENRRLARALKRSKTPAGQAAALQRFARALSDVLADLRAMEVPRVLRVSHNDQIRRLDATRVLSVRLREALRDADAKRIARLLKRFRGTAGDREPRSGLARDAITEYNRRYQQLNEAYVQVNRENVRLNRELR
jgi:hypothetical protein